MNELEQIMRLVQDWYIGKITYQELEQKIEEILLEREES